MEYLQYVKNIRVIEELGKSFKPCYKWNTFNTLMEILNGEGVNSVLNLVISGIPSIRIL